jgi:class 3 adenylate cyclase/tetratricopeptide (TPR) repeat protein
VLTCPACGKENPEGFAFCGHCKAPLASAESTGAVRKTVTVVFCDVTGSTSLGEQLDPESLRRLMSRFFHEMKTVLERHGGTVEKFIGDAVMAVFGIPTVHEDDPLRAVRAAAEMRDALATLNKELERDRGVTIASRIGVNTGEVVAGDPAAGQTLVTGDAVNVAARLEQAAGAGEILIGEATLRLVRDAVVADAVEPLALKGKTGTVAAFRLQEVAPGLLGIARRLDTPLVGRTDELRGLQDAFDRAVRDQTCVLVTILGTPGVGKSRLTEEFLVALDDASIIVRGRCLSYGDGITYWPVVEMLTAVAGIVDVDGPTEIRAKIETLLEGSADSAIAAERLAEFLGLAGAAASPEETHWAIRRLFEALAARRPLVAVFEDIHWAEPALLDLIEHISEWTRDAPILLVCSARPDLLDARPTWGGGQIRATSFLLEPLTGDESDRLVSNLLGRSESPRAVARRVMDTAEGNPLFVEQMVAMLIDDGLLRPVEDGWVVTGDLSTISVPPTIAGLLQARLDRLPPEEQRVIERGSVEGRVFHWSSVTELSSDLDPDEVGRHLMALLRRDLIGPEQSLFGGSEAFRFRHALIRDAAYARMPKQTRSELHEGHAAWLERTAGDRVAEYEEVLAYHLEQAARLRSELGPLDERGRELATEASHRLASGGRRAIARGDVRAGSNLLGRALTLMEPEDPARADLLVRSGAALTAAGQMEEAGVVLREALAAAGRSGDTRAEIHARLARLSLLAAIEPEGVAERVRQETDEAIPALERMGDDEGLVLAWRVRCESSLMWCRGSEMVAAAEREAVHAERAGDPAGLAHALSWLLIVMLQDATRPEEGIRRCQELWARAPHDRVVEAFALLVRGVFEAMLRRYDEGRALLHRGREILTDLGMGLELGGTLIFVGQLEVMAGDVPAAERALRQGIELLRGMGEQGYLSAHVCELAFVLFDQGKFDEAEEKSRLAEAISATDDLAMQLEWRQVRAKLLARRGEVDAAIALGEEAVRLGGDSDFVELRAKALDDLAEVYVLAGKRGEATRSRREALRLYERKGNLPVADRVRAKLGPLENRSA